MRNPIKQFEVVPNWVMPDFIDPIPAIVALIIAPLGVLMLAQNPLIPFSVSALGYPIFAATAYNVVHMASGRRWNLDE